MPTTHDLVGVAKELATALDEALDSDGEVPEELGALLDRHLDATADKAAAIGHVLTAIGDELAIVAEDKRRAATAARRLAAKQERVRGLLHDLLEAHRELTGTAKIRTVYGTAYLARRTSYRLPDLLDAWPADLVLLEPRADTARARARMKAGESLGEGFKVVVTHSPAWRGV